MYPDKNKIPVRTKLIELADDQNTLFRLKWTDIAKDASNPNPYATITIDANGSDDSKLLILLNLGASATDYSQYQFSAAASGVTDPGGVDSSPTHAQCTTLGALINAINALGPEALKHTSSTALGLWATRNDAPADYSLDTDDFIDLAATRIQPVFVDYLYRDASEITTISGRIGYPDSANGKKGRGRIELIKVQALINSNSATDCDFKISQDQDETDATKEVEQAFTRKVPDNTWTDLWDFSNGMPPVINGPILVEATATTSMAAGAKLLVMYRNVEI